MGRDPRRPPLQVHARLKTGGPLAAYKVIITPEALADLQGIYEWIAADSADQAARMAGRILDAIDSLTDMPHRFAAVRTRRKLPYQLRKVVVRPYKVFY